MFGLWFGERFGSGDGERKTLLTRQIAFEPLPASDLFPFIGRILPRGCLRPSLILKVISGGCPIKVADDVKNRFRNRHRIIVLKPNNVQS